MATTTRRGRVTVRLRPEGLAALANNADGQAALRRRAERVAALARLLSANNGTIPQGIVVGPVINNTIKVISTNPHSVLVHNGSRAHIIRPRTKRFLKFTVGGRTVFARVVNHPGYKGNPFLTNAMALAGS